MASLQWERYLFKEYNLVALNLGTSVQLFSVLVRQRKEGKNPVLIRIGTLVGLQSHGTKDWEKVVDKIEGFLNGSLKKRDVVGIVETEMNGDYRGITDRRSNVMIGFLNLFNVDGGQSEGLTFEAKNVQTERIHSRLIDNLFTENPPLWVPDLNKIALEEQASNNNGLTEIWVVTEVKYSTKLTVGPTMGSSMKAGMNLPNQLTSIPIDIGCGIKGTRTTTGMVVASAPKVPFGFKAVKLAYDSGGNLQKVSRSEKVRPKFRNHKLFDPDECPSYHMGNLFVDENEDFLECLTLAD